MPVSVEAPALPFRMFAVQVAAVQTMCPSVLRVTFTGDDLDRFADNGFDQRIKFFLPLENAPYDELLSLESSADWYGRWRAMPDDKRHPIRTYTARGVRQDRREVDVDIVLHGDLGPASRWALNAAPGDDLVILGPNAEADGPHGGVDFVPAAAHRPPAHRRRRDRAARHRGHPRAPARRRPRRGPDRDAAVRRPPRPRCARTA